jgi:hypothetical protein
MPNMASAGGYSSPDGRVRAEERMLHDRDWRGTPPWVVDKRRPWTPFAEVKPPTARDRPLVSALHAPRNSTPILTGCGEVTDFDGSVQRGGPPCNPIGERGRSGPADAGGPGNRGPDQGPKPIDRAGSPPPEPRPIGRPASASASTPHERFIR